MPIDGDDGFFPTSGNELVDSGILSCNNIFESSPSDLINCRNQKLSIPAGNIVFVF